MRTLLGEKTLLRVNQFDEMHYNQEWEQGKSKLLFGNRKIITTPLHYALTLYSRHLPDVFSTKAIVRLVKWDSFIR